MQKKIIIMTAMILGLICCMLCTGNYNSSTNIKAEEAKGWETPFPPLEKDDEDKTEKIGKVQNYHVDLSRYQTVFHKSLMWIDLQNELNKDWFRITNYEQIKIDFRVEYNNSGDENENNMVSDVIFMLVNETYQLDGYQEGKFKNVNAHEYVHRPENDSLLEAVFDIYNIQSNEKIAGINIRPFSASWDWPKELETLTITGIEFVAKKYAVYPGTPTATPTITPTENSEPQISHTPTAAPQVKSTNLPINTPVISAPQKVTNLKLKAGKKKKIKLSWKQVKSADGYEVYRSVRKNRGFYKIADGLKNKNGVTDVKVIYAKKYYYKVRAYRINENSRTYGAFSNVKKQIVRRRAPSFTLQRKITPDGIKYVSVRIKSWSDPYLQMWVQVGNKKYKRIPLAKKKIKKKNTTLNFKYSGGKTKIKFCICTYRIRKNKKEYSESKVKQI